MSKVRLTGSNSGYVEIAAAADAGNLTFTMPTTGTGLFGNGNNVISGITTFSAALDINSSIDVSGASVLNGTTTFNNDVTFDGATAGYDVVWDRSDNQLEFADHAKISLGSGGDMQLYHDGSDSRISNSGGLTYILGDVIRFRNHGDTGTVLNAALSGVDLYASNAVKLSTNASGVNVTGICTATSFSGSGANLTSLPAGNLTGTLPAISGANLTGISSPLSFRNLIINGACMVAQRGTSSSSVGYQTVDRFKLGAGGADEVPQQYQGTLGSHESPYNEGFRYTYYIVNGNQTGGAGAGDYAEIQYKLEAQDLATSGWNYTSASSYITLSFWVKSSVGQNFYGFVFSADGTSQRYIFQTGNITANSWNKIVVTIPGGTNVQFDNDVNEGFIIKWIPFYGTDKTNNSATPGSWANYNGAARCPDNTTTWWTTNNSTFFITGIQLEVGDTATTFEHRSYQDEFLRCCRYYQEITGNDHNHKGSSGTSGSFKNCLIGSYNGDGDVRVTYYHTVPMRVDPSLTVSAMSHFDLEPFDQEPASIQLNRGGSTQSTLIIVPTNQGSHRGFACQLTLDNASANITFDSEL